MRASRRGLFGLLAAAVAAPRHALAAKGGGRVTRMRLSLDAAKLPALRERMEALEAYIPLPGGRLLPVTMEGRITSALALRRRTNAAAAGTRAKIAALGAASDAVAPALYAFSDRLTVRIPPQPETTEMTDGSHGASKPARSFIVECLLVAIDHVRQEAEPTQAMIERVPQWLKQQHETLAKYRKSEAELLQLLRQFSPEEADRVASAPVGQVHPVARSAGEAITEILRPRLHLHIPGDFDPIIPAVAATVSD